MEAILSSEAQRSSSISSSRTALPFLLAVISRRGRGRGGGGRRRKRRRRKKKREEEEKVHCKGESIESKKDKQGFEGKEVLKD